MTPRIALLTIGDGRDLLQDATMRSLDEALGGSGENYAVPPGITSVVRVDDRAHELGFAGAIRHGWDTLRALGGFDYVLHVEEDWRFDRALDLALMADVLDAHPHLAQVALRRGPVNQQERAGGGVVEMWPDEYQERSLVVEPIRTGRRMVGKRAHWLEHSLYFTTNPSLYPRELLNLDWPLVPGSEAAFTQTCRDHAYRFALWGARDSGTWVTHTGTDQRSGTGY